MTDNDSSLADCLRWSGMLVESILSCSRSAHVQRKLLQKRTPEIAPPD